MADGIRLDMNTTEKDARWVRGGLLPSAVQVSPDLLRAAVERSMQPGLMALQRNVQQIPARTGRLRRSPAIVTRKYGKPPFYRIVGLVGYRAGVAPHARYLEMGTPPRAGRGKVLPRRSAWTAFFTNRGVMEQNLKSEMERLVSDAVSKAT